MVVILRLFSAGGIPGGRCPGTASRLGLGDILVTKSLHYYRIAITIPFDFVVFAPYYKAKVPLSL